MFLFPHKQILIGLTHWSKQSDYVLATIQYSLYKYGQQLKKIKQNKKGKNKWELLPTKSGIKPQYTLFLHWWATGHKGNMEILPKGGRITVGI